MFCDCEVSEGSGGVNATYSRLEVADDVISGEDAETVQEYMSVQICALLASSFVKNVWGGRARGWRTLP